MAKVVFGLGLATSLAMLAIAVIGAPASGVTSQGRVTAATADRCGEDLTADEGYGVSRKIANNHCDQAE